MRDRELDTAERIASLEVQREELSRTVDKHENEIQSVKADVGHIVNDVRQIRNALYVMAVAITCNIPPLAHILDHLLSLF